MLAGNQKYNWVVDSGASYHIVSNVAQFQEEIFVANGSTMLSRGKGMVNLEVGGKKQVLEYCLFIPEVSRNII